MNLRMSHGQAMRSVLGRSLVTHFTIQDLVRSYSAQMPPWDKGPVSSVTLVHESQPPHRKQQLLGGFRCEVEVAVVCHLQS
jgi:hypothetical protein